MAEQMQQWRWVALGLVVAGVALGAFSLGRQAAAPPVAAQSVNLADAALVEAQEVLLEQDDAPPDEATEPLANTPTATLVVVYISGAVAHPDTYQLPAEARVKDVVLAAGGFLASAASERINLSAHIRDAEHIHVPRIDEVDQGAAAALEAPATAEAASGLVDLNSASASELEALPRIGEALAGRIIAWREANGPFKAVDDLLQVKGVSAAVLAEIRDLVVV